MRGTAAPESRVLRLVAQRADWLHFAWKGLLALAIFALMSTGSPLLWALSWTFVNTLPATLLIWGALLVGVAGSNLFEGHTSLRWAWVALAIGAYGALAIPGVTAGADKLLYAVGPVAALTLTAHILRRDLPRALRDWCLVMGLALYAGLGVQAMWLVVGGMGPEVFLQAVLLPPLVFEGGMLLLRRTRLPVRLSNAVSLVLAAAIAVAVISLTQFNRQMPGYWALFFHLLAGLPIAWALLTSLLTRPAIEAASGAHNAEGGINLGRALVELSHGPILISLALYIPLRLIQ